MDEFGVLTERYELKPQGKSVLMASSKRNSNVTDYQTRMFGSNPKSSQNGSRSNHNFAFDFDIGVFSSTDNKTQCFGDGIDDLLGGNAKSNDVSFDYDSFFSGSNKLVSPSSSLPLHTYVDDIFGGMSEQSVGVDDLLDKIGGLYTNSKGSNEKSHDFGDD